jgi:ubiquinone/menaquinone biosynthesis C-methylase UbiE
MKLPRLVQVAALALLNNTLPPIMRDSRLLMTPLMRVVFGRHAPLVMDFKDRAMSMSEAEYIDFYRQVAPFAISKETDLNRKCIKRMLDEVVDCQVLEAGCGRGFLARKLAARNDVTACDIVISDDTRRQIPTVRFFEANVDHLPFADRTFEIVVCTHTLEHTRDLLSSIAELRRVTRRRLIIVVPKERPYRFTFNAHLHFFPYPHSLQAVMGANRTATCDIVGGDLYYVEDL